MVLLQNADRIVEKEELMRLVWPDTVVEENNLTRNISSLRKALEEGPNEHRFIVTIPGRGYQFASEMSVIGSESELIFERHARAEFQIEEEDEQPALVPSLQNSKPRARRHIGGWLVLSVVTLTAVWFYFSRSMESKLSPLRVVPVTSLSDQAEDASLSPDGNYVAFKRSSDSPDVSGIYIKQIGSEHLLQLTKNRTDFSPVWSPDGLFIAFSRYANAEHDIYVVSAIGGTERKLYFGAPAHPPLSWSPDGKLIAFTAKDSNQNTYSINLLSVENLDTRKLTDPGAEQQDWAPAFSPDGKELAFVRTNGALNMADIFITPANGGAVRRLTFDNTVIPDPPTWTRDGRSIVFSSPRVSIPTLWRIPASGGSAVQIPQVGVVAVHPSVSPGRNRLAYDQIMGHSSIWSLQLGKLGKRYSPALVTASGGFNWAPEFSPDGKRITFLSGRSGPLEVWTCNRDGLDLIQLTNLGGATLAGPPRWSPDGQRIAFNSALGEHNAIFVLNAEGGLVRPVTRDASDNVNASWSRDGKWIYFTSNRSGQWQIWKMPSEGGDPLQLTKQGGFRAFESADGKIVYYAKTSSDPDIWRVPATGGQESPLSPRLHVQKWRDWALVDNGILFFRERSAPHPVLSFFDFATARANDVATFEKPGDWISASADGKFVLYDQFDDQESNIMLLENFR
jgi:Tol biopolymer transport system component/DNA-binding winged helix-turn-helix (wHTH) protein